ncbi:unnamed protein product [Effrenium voratum]|nr:unnamed protein product [Effrenium voratum]
MSDWRPTPSIRADETSQNMAGHTHMTTQRVLLTSPDMSCPIAGRGYYDTPWDQIQAEHQAKSHVQVAGPINFDKTRQQDDPLIEKEHVVVLTTHDTSFRRTCCILWQGLVCIWKMQIYVALLFIRTFWGSDYDSDGAVDLRAWRPLPKLVQSEALPERSNLPPASEVSKQLFRRLSPVMLDPNISQTQCVFAHSIVLLFLGADRTTTNPILTRGGLTKDFVTNNLYGVDKTVKRTGKGGKIELSSDGLPMWDAEQKRFEVGNVEYGNESTYRLILYTLLYRLHNLVCDKLLEVEPDWDDDRLFQEAAKQVFYSFGRVFAVDYIRNYFGIFGWGYELSVSLMMKVVESIRVSCFLYYTVGSVLRFLHPGPWASSFQEYISFYRLHSLVPDTLGETRVAEHVGNPARFKAMGLRDAAGAAVDSAAGSIGLRNTPVVLNNEYLDVDELAILRQRAMKLGSINDFRANLGVPKNSFKSFSSNPAVSKKLEDLYSEPNDVDWFVGVMSNCREVSSNGSGVFGIDLLSIACHFVINSFISDRQKVVPDGGPDGHDFTLSFAEILKQTRLPQEAGWILRSEEQGGVTRLRPLNAGFQTCFGRLVYAILNMCFTLALVGAFLTVGFFLVVKGFFRRIGLGCLNLHNVILFACKLVLQCVACLIFCL